MIDPSTGVRKSTISNSQLVKILHLSTRKLVFEENESMKLPHFSFFGQDFGVKFSTKNQI